MTDKGYLRVEYQKKDKQILGRILKIQSPPYPQEVFNMLNRGYLENDEGGIKYSKGGYLENYKDNNISNNNTNINNIKYIVDYLNLKANANYKYTTNKTKTLINARFNEGFTKEDFIKVIDNKTKEWLNNKEMCQYLRPETLFGTKFESYLNQKQVKLTTKDIAGNIDWSNY